MISEPVWASESHGTAPEGEEDPVFCCWNYTKNSRQYFPSCLRSDTRAQSKEAENAFDLNSAPCQFEFTFLQVPEGQRYVRVERPVAILCIEYPEFRLRKIPHAPFTIFRAPDFLHVDVNITPRLETHPKSFQFNCKWPD